MIILFSVAAFIAGVCLANKIKGLYAQGVAKVKEFLAKHL